MNITLAEIITAIAMLGIVLGIAIPVARLRGRPVDDDHDSPD